MSIFFSKSKYHANEALERRNDIIVSYESLKILTV